MRPHDHQKDSKIPAPIAGAGELMFTLMQLSLNKGNFGHWLRHKAGASVGQAHATEHLAQLFGPHQAHNNRRRLGVWRS
jgi:hypothetical protein